MENPNPKSEMYTCKQCGVETKITISSAIVCNNCYNRIFRKASSTAIIRVKAV